MSRKILGMATAVVALAVMTLGPAQAGPRPNLTRDHADGYGLTDCPDGSGEWCVMNGAGDEVANTIHVDGSFTPPEGKGDGTQGQADGGVTHRYRVRGTDTVSGTFALNVTKREVEQLGAGYAFVLARFCLTSGSARSCEVVAIQPSAQPCTLEAELTLTKERMRYAWQSTSFIGVAGKASGVTTSLAPLGSTARFAADGTLAMEAFAGASPTAGEVTGTCAAAPTGQL